MTNFIYLFTKEIFTAKALKMRGVNPNDIDDVRKANYAIVYYEYPQYDKMYYKIIPKAELTQRGQDYAQEFDIVVLDFNEVIQNIQNYLLRKDTKLYDAVEKIKGIITHKRWEIEIGGLTLPNGVKILTSIDDQNRIATSIQGMETAGLNEIDFKSYSGWVKLTLAELKQISIAVTMHVEQCFARECALHKMCDEANTAEELKRIVEEEIDKGWPTYEKLV